MKKITHILSNLRKLKSVIRSQRGDTLIEVIIASIIIGIVLFSAYGLTTKAFQLGQSAKERSQAAQILQSQAEGLRSLRDNANSYLSFCNSVSPLLGGNGFHLEKSGNAWLAQANDSAEGWNPGTEATGDPVIADYYLVKITGQLYTTNISSGVQSTTSSCAGNVTLNPADKALFTISITWPRLGGGPTETSTLATKLVDQTLPDLTPDGGGGGARPQCDDDIDNDSDGRIDYPNDSSGGGGGGGGCTSATDNSEGQPQCNDNLDNDGQGGTDESDNDCQNSQDDDEGNAGGSLPECSDGIDNDGDQDIDRNPPIGFDNDSDCNTSNDDDELN